MARSMRSKHKKKMRSLRRQKFKPLYDQRLKELAEIGIKMEADRAKEEDSEMKDNDENMETKEVTPASHMDLDQTSEQSTASEKRNITKLLKAKVPVHLLSQRKKRKLLLREKEKKANKGKKRKSIKW